ncbi:MAG: D-cysteine desulfhydrase family protein [Clostridiales bacterium]|nr:D-cysteine desulfhydrase family protein [Clostridiales bacterium]
MLYGHEKEPFLHLPTPLERLDTLSEKLGINLYIKRDDLTGLGTGGNKLRKLEYFIKDALNKKATALVTVGGPQTNHGRLTAAVAAKYGMRCTIVAVGEYPGEISANILLDRIMGCTVYLVQKDGDASEGELSERAVRETMAGYEAAGERPYFVPLGGSNELGALGYCECAMEIDEQCRNMGIDDGRIVVTSGSMGTYIGCFIGLRHVGSKLGLLGVCISPSSDPDPAARAKKYFDRCKDYLGLEFDAQESDFNLTNEYHWGAYNNPVKEVREAIYEMGRKEGIILDPCYTGKTYYAIEQLCTKGEIKEGENIIFIHTGGVPGINGPVHRQAMEEELMDGLIIKKPER